MKYFKKTDLIIIFIIIATCISGVLLFKRVNNKGNVSALIYYKSDLVKIVPLNEHKEYTFSINENKNVVFQVYEDGSIAFIQSNCADKICIKTGKLNKPGDTAACLPNKIIVKIVSDNDSNEVDMATG